MKYITVILCLLFIGCTRTVKGKWEFTSNILGQTLDLKIEAEDFEDNVEFPALESWIFTEGEGQDEE